MGQSTGLRVRSPGVAVAPVQDPSPSGLRSINNAGLSSAAPGAHAPDRPAGWTRFGDRGAAPATAPTPPRSGAPNRSPEPWKQPRAGLRSFAEAHFRQDKESSCVPAAMRNMLLALRGVDIPEATLQRELGALDGDPNHDFARHGINPRHAVSALRRRGVAVISESDVSLDRLAQLAEGGRPMLVGIKKPFMHRMMLDEVERRADGTQVFHFRNSKKSQVQTMTRAEFAKAYNPDAIVIIPI